MTLFPMHYDIEKGTWGAKMYGFINGCGDKYNLRSCRSNEESRMAMDRDQIPRQRNFTELGFAKLRAPKAVYEAARCAGIYTEKRARPVLASLPHANHWVADSTMCSFEDRRLNLGVQNQRYHLGPGEAYPGGVDGPETQTDVSVRYPVAFAGPSWPCRSTTFSDLRHNNVDQDVDEDWPIEVVGHDGVAYNATLKPGDMVV